MNDDRLRKLAGLNEVVTSDDEVTRHHFNDMRNILRSPRTFQLISDFDHVHMSNASNKYNEVLKAYDAFLREIKDTV